MLVKRFLAVVVFCGVVFGLTGCGEPEAISDEEAISLFNSELYKPPEGDFNDIWASSRKVCQVIRETISRENIDKEDEAALLDYVRGAYTAESSDILNIENFEGETMVEIYGRDTAKFVEISRKWQCPDTLP